MCIRYICYRNGICRLNQYGTVVVVVLVVQKEFTIYRCCDRAQCGVHMQSIIFTANYLSSAAGLVEMNTHQNRLYDIDFIVFDLVAW